MGSKTAHYIYPKGTLIVQYLEVPGVQSVLREVLEEDCYRIRRLYDTKTQVKLCVDVGAYMGFFARLVRFYWPEAYILCIEPNPRFTKVIFDNGANLALPCAIRYDKRSDFYVPEEPAGAVMYDPTINFSEDIPSSYEHLQVVSMRLEEALANGDQIDLLKLDCEGSEFDILCGMTPPLRNRIKRIVGEYHHLAGYRYIEQILKLRYGHLTPRFVGKDPLDTIAGFEAA